MLDIWEFRPEVPAGKPYVACKGSSSLLCPICERQVVANLAAAKDVHQAVLVVVPEALLGGLIQTTLAMPNMRMFGHALANPHPKQMHSSP